jgi:tryptophan-associated transmembrane protein
MRCHTAGMETQPRLDTSRPSNLRLAGFALTAVGALVMGVGARLDWVTVGLGQIPNSQSVDNGADLLAGKIALGCAIAVLILVLVGRATSGRWRIALGIVTIALAAFVAALAAWFIVGAPDHYSPVDNERLVAALAAVFKKTPDEIRAGLASTIDQLGGYTHVGPGPWVVIVGGVLVIVGGVLTLRWARRLRQNDGAGEPAPWDAPPAA